MNCIHTIFIWVIQHCIDVFTGHNSEEQFFLKKSRSKWLGLVPQSSLCPPCSVFCSKMSLETVPKELRRLRACLLCSLVKVSENNKPEKPVIFFLLWVKNNWHSQQSLFCSYCSTICDHHHIGLQLLMHCTIIWFFYPGYFFTVSLILHSLRLKRVFRIYLVMKEVEWMKLAAGTLYQFPLPCPFHLLCCLPDRITLCVGSYIIIFIGYQIIQIGVFHCLKYQAHQ